MCFYVVGKKWGYEEVVVVCNVNGSVLVVGGKEGDRFVIMVKGEGFKGEVWMDEREKDVRVVRLEGVVYEEEVGVMYRGMVDGMWGRRGIECCGGMRYEVGVEVYGVSDVVVRRRREWRCERLMGKGEWELGGEVGRVDGKF